MAVGYGKLLLFGEHAAVYGFPAVGMRLESSIELSVGYADDDAARERALLAALPMSSAAQLIAAMEQLPRLLSSHYAELAADIPDQRPWLSTIAGTLPMSLGFGSSAAFCTGIIRAVVPGIERYGLDRFWTAAHELEHTFHGRPSGIDTALATFPGASMIQPQTSGLPSRVSCLLPPAWLVIGAVPRRRSTAELIEGLRLLREQEPEETQARIERLGRYAASVPEMSDASTFGTLANAAQAELSALGLSSPDLDQALSVLADCGALGAKLSGAGGGGAFFGVLATEEEAKKTAATVEAAADVLVTMVLSLREEN
jgi:mevalonate kinase